MPSEPIWKYACMSVGFIFRPLDGPLWYIRALLIWLVLLPLVYFALSKKLWGYVLALIAFLYMIAVPYLFPQAQRAFLTTFPPYSVGVFLYGAYLAYHNVAMSKHFRRWFWFYVGGGCAAWLIQVPSALNSLAIDMRGLLYVAVVFRLPQGFLKKVEESPVYRILAMSSFFLYAAHKLPCHMAHLMLRNILPKLRLAAWPGTMTIIMFLEVGLIVLFCCTACVWLNKRFPRMGSLLSGRG